MNMLHVLQVFIENLLLLRYKYITKANNGDGNINNSLGSKLPQE